MIARSWLIGDSKGAAFSGYSVLGLHFDFDLFNMLGMVARRSADAFVISGPDRRHALPKSPRYSIVLAGCMGTANGDDWHRDEGQECENPV